MASSAVARDTLASLRQQIAKIEGRPVEQLDGTKEDLQLRRCHGQLQADVLATGAARFDAALGGGLPAAGLTEIHAVASRDAGAAAGFVLALARLSIERRAAPLLWIGMAETFREAGHPYPPGLLFLHGIEPSRLLVAQAQKLFDALWIAEQAASLEGLAAILIETRDSAARLDLTATRRLHRRALDAGHPVFLLRHAALPEPTAAPYRLVVRSAPAGLRQILGRPLAGSIGPPAFLVEISKNRTASPNRFILEWNAHARAFEERAAQDLAPVVPASQHRASAAPEAGSVLAFPAATGQAAAGRQPAGEQHPAHRRLG